MKKTHDLAVKVREYQDNQGKTKGEWLNIGSVMENENGAFLLIKRTFNPAGIPNPDNRDNIMVSMFADKPKEQKQTAKPDDFIDDDISF